MHQAFVTVGLGFGDESKGALVDYLAHHHRASLVVRYSGGCQCAHNVVLADGREHVFAQFGAGSFSGAATYLDEHVIIDPPALSKEYLALCQALQTTFDPYGRLFIHRNCLVVTPYLQALNRLRESLRGDQRHGSCGRGIGETRSLAIGCQKRCILACHLRDRADLIDRLEYQRAYAVEIARELGGRGMPEFQWLLESPLSVSERLTIAPSVTLCDGAILRDHESVVFEGAQGVLLDESKGFHPHTTWSDVTTENAWRLIYNYAADADVTTIGCLRIFPTRHGAGALPTHDPAMPVSDARNPYNQWQGSLRAGWPDVNLWRYALARQKVDGVFDGVFVSHIDQFKSLPAQQICKRYSEPLPDAWIRAPKDCSLETQASLNSYLASAKPIYEPSTVGQVLESLGELTHVLGTASGPTREDRQWLKC